MSGSQNQPEFGADYPRRLALALFGSVALGAALMPGLFNAAAANAAVAFNHPFTSPRATLGRRFGSDYGGPNTQYPTHTGQDFVHPSTGLSGYVYAIAAGTSSGLLEDSTYGNRVEITHAEGWKSLYGHLAPGAFAPAGAIAASGYVGVMGDTGVAEGVHLHVSMWHNGSRVDPADLIQDAPFPVNPGLPPQGDEFMAAKFYTIAGSPVVWLDQGAMFRRPMKDQQDWLDTASLLGIPAVVTNNLTTARSLGVNVHDMVPASTLVP